MVIFEMFVDDGRLLQTGRLQSGPSSDPFGRLVARLVAQQLALFGGRNNVIDSSRLLLFVDMDPFVGGRRLAVAGRI